MDLHFLVKTAIRNPEGLISLGSPLKGRFACNGIEFSL
jgi:hypothetical protein